MKSSKILASMITAIALGGQVLFAPPTDPKGAEQKLDLTGRAYKAAVAKAAENLFNTLRFCQATAAAGHVDTRDAARLGCEQMAYRATQDLLRLQLHARGDADREAFARGFAATAQLRGPLRGTFEYKFDNGK